jgi:hypothetical protein
MKTDSTPNGDLAVAVVLPWREQESRRYALRLVESWYGDNLPQATIIKADAAGEPFNLAAARNQGMREAVWADVVILNDADTIPEINPLWEAINACQETGVVHLPYTEYRSLRIMGTQEYLRGIPPRACDYLSVDGACSGVYVTMPETWWVHGGQDEAFRGWGFEDAAWMAAHKTLLGQPPYRHDGAVFAFHHDGAVKEGVHYDANAARCYLYLQAEHDYDAMSRLVFGE